MDFHPVATTGRLNPSESTHPKTQTRRLPISRLTTLAMGNTALPNSSAPQPHALAYFCARTTLMYPREAVELL